MNMRLIATTSNHDYAPLALNGQMVIENWDALRSFLASLNRDDPAYATLLAEPVTDSGQNRVDWYGDVPANATPDGSAELLTRFEAMRADILSRAQALTTQGDQRSKFISRLLPLALQIPAANAIYAGRHGPVLVGWGHTMAGERAGAAALTGRGRMSAAPPPSPPPPPPPSEPPRADNIAPPSPPPVHEEPIAPPPPPRREAMPIMPPPFHPVEDMHIAPPPRPIAPAALLVDMKSWWPWGGVLSGLIVLALLLGVLLWYPMPWSAWLCRYPYWLKFLLVFLIMALLFWLFSRFQQWHQRRSDIRLAAQQGGRNGPLQVILAWNDINDLDLVVVCPSGESINFRYPAAAGGRLDCDANMGAPLTTRPVEEISWENQPPSGRYQVYVSPFNMHNAARPLSAYRILVILNGRHIRSIRGRIGKRNAPKLVCDFQVP